ncbi:MAG: AMIN domain-containing protein, partial [Gemmatimonadota bacterium]
MILKTILASVLLAWSSGGPGAVQEVRIAQVGGETEIVVVTSGEVSVRDFVLDEPPRLILDLSGAETGLPKSSYEAIGRGGVVRIRSSWFRPGVLRLVFDMEEISEYEVLIEAGQLRVRFANPGGEFDAWST